MASLSPRKGVRSVHKPARAASRRALSSLLYQALDHDRKRGELGGGESLSRAGRDSPRRVPGRARGGQDDDGNGLLEGKDPPENAGRFDTRQRLGQNDGLESPAPRDRFGRSGVRCLDDVEVAGLQGVAGGGSQRGSPRRAGWHRWTSPRLPAQSRSRFPSC